MKRVDNECIMAHKIRVVADQTLAFVLFQVVKKAKPIGGATHLQRRLCLETPRPFVATQTTVIAARQQGRMTQIVVVVVDFRLCRERPPSGLAVSRFQPVIEAVGAMPGYVEILRPQQTRDSTTTTTTTTSKVKRRFFCTRILRNMGRETNDADRL